MVLRQSPLIISIHLKPHTVLKLALGELDKISFETGTKQLFDKQFTLRYQVTYHGQACHSFLVPMYIALLQQ